MTHNQISIIAPDCGSQLIHQRFNLPYYSPFIDIKIEYPDYIYLLTHFFNINLYNVREVNREMYQRNGGRIMDSYWEKYPIVCIDNQIIIHPMHCICYQEFYDKWMKRVSRINYHNLLFILLVDDINDMNMVVSATKRFSKIIITKNVNHANKLIKGHKEVFICDHALVQKDWDSDYINLFNKPDFDEWFSHIEEYTRR